MLGGVSVAQTARIQSKTELWHENLSNPYSNSPSLHSSFIECSKPPPINRQTRRKLSKEISSISFHTQVQENITEGPVIELKKHQARPPGCSFLGARATETLANLDDPRAQPIQVIVDSGSDITLISQQALDQMIKPPKVRSGQRIKLVQVTGNTIINGYVALDLYFETEKGPVLMKVEAYVVKGMSTPFILGNDFTDQYSISLLRNDGQSSLLFGESGRSKKVHNTVTSPFLDEDGHAFKILVRPGITSKVLKAKAHRKSQKLKRRFNYRSRETHVRTTCSVQIAPESTRLVKVQANFATDSDTMFIEKNLATNGGPEDVYGCADTLIDRKLPFVFISNFSKKPVLISAGQVIGQGHDPSTWLDSEGKFTKDQREAINMHANLLRTVINTEGTSMSKNPFTQTVRSKVKTLHDASRRDYSADEPLAEPALEGGPKTAGMPDELVPSIQLLNEVDISSNLTQAQTNQLQKILEQHKEVFGLEGRLGHYEEEVSIPLLPDTKPISIPPFHASPANREVIDKQMDAWIELGVIEPSKSPWGAPVFIAYRNNKPRMVIDLRRLNEKVVADEFPLPRQDEILQSLEGSQYLTTLDALAGFTQLSIKAEDREKLAFRCHRGLFQFKRMPFGYRNGPAVFQRVMQGILAPFLWIFALVYINDIVIFSKSFEDHLVHIDLVLGAIKGAKITLSPGKCHFGYQSLMLLGQKVSRLGLSTHKEKVDAILQLENPKNVHDLQTFLGMMVYFSSYIPFYAWIVHPLFQLLKRGSKWKWEKEEQNAYDVCKQVLTQAPVRAHPILGLPYRIYSDACDFALAAILQQVQPIKVKDLQGTKTYELLERAFKAGEPIPDLATHLVKENSDVPPQGTWSTNFEDTLVYVERVIAYWSRVLQSAERNYSPTEREALALKEGLIKFQPYLEGERILAITDHAALTWSKTFQNVNRRLLTWGLVYSAFPNMKIVHRAGRVHSNVDPISRLRHRMPPQSSPLDIQFDPLQLKPAEDPLRSMFEELGPKFEEKLLTVATSFAESELQLENENMSLSVSLPLVEDREVTIPYDTLQTYSTIVQIDDQEIRRWKDAYVEDTHFNLVSKNKEKEDGVNAAFPQYHISKEGLIYFVDSMGKSRLCVPKNLRADVMQEAHNTITEAAHGGYFKTYNRISGTYYWPRMSREIKVFVNTCDVCQKIKPRRHGPVGLLQSIPVPSQPFEVVSMDFIPELPTSNGFDNVLVIVDKLTKYAIFVPTTTRITEVETARLFFKHVISKFGIPRQIISDRDTRWRGDFWKETCRLMGMKRSLTTSYHPQSDGQAEIMNQGLEISIRAYIGPEQDDWSEMLDALALSYNSSTHTATGFSPAYLLRGFQPVTGTSILGQSASVNRTGILNSGTDDQETSHNKALDLVEGFVAERSRARDALLLGQIFQRKSYNKGRLNWEFKEGDKVVINRQNLGLLKEEKGRGNKFLARYEGPFEVMKKISAVAYRLRMPASYGMHPVLNIEHLEKYQESPSEFGDRPQLKTNRSDFDALPEFEVDKIVAERTRKGKNGRRIPIYRLRYTNYGPEGDTWETRQNLKNAPDVLLEWEKFKADQKRKSRLTN